MPREKGTPNTPQSIIDEIIERHRQGITIKQLAQEYGKPYKTMKNMCTRENNKARRKTNYKKSIGKIKNMVGNDA